MTRSADGPAVPKWLMVLLLVGGACCVGQMAISGTESTRSGTDQTTRFTRGLPFSPWYEEVETRTATGFETRSTVNWFSGSGLALVVGLFCMSLAWRWRWRPRR